MDILKGKDLLIVHISSFILHITLVKSLKSDSAKYA